MKDVGSGLIIIFGDVFICSIRFLKQLNIGVGYCPPLRHSLKFRLQGINNPPNSFYSEKCGIVTKKCFEIFAFYEAEDYT